MLNILKEIIQQLSVNNDAGWYQKKTYDIELVVVDHMVMVVAVDQGIVAVGLVVVL